MGQCFDACGDRGVVMSQASTPVSQDVADSGEEDDDVMPDAAEKQMAAAVSAGGRRRGIAAQSVVAQDIKDFKKVVHAKDATSEQYIKETIKGNDKMQVLFGHLSPSSLQDVINAFKERTATKNEDLIMQGEEGDCLYILGEGEVECFVKRAGVAGQSPKGSKVATLSAGSLFGELALMYSAPRAATVTVVSPSARLWQLDREPFKMLLAQQSQTQFEMYTGWLGDVDILKPLNQFELSRLSDCLQNEFFDVDDVVCRQSEEGDQFYILEEGSCSAFIDGPRGEKEVKVYKERGEYFGEVALIEEHSKRKATVRATGEGCTLLVLSKHDFEEVLGPIQVLLASKAKTYKPYSAFAR